MQTMTQGEKELVSHLWLVVLLLGAIFVFREAIFPIKQAADAKHSPPSLMSLSIPRQK